MQVELLKFVQEPSKPSFEWMHVEQLADRLIKELNAPETLKRIHEANRPGTSSAKVQEAFRPSAERLGFQSERKRLFSDTIPGLRPDYFIRLNDFGIILEVERGKTTTNNMDLLDFWKCHICGKASYLFLLVPKALKHNPKMTPKNEFRSVERRLAQFFEPGKYTNVRGLCLFGY